MHEYKVASTCVGCAPVAATVPGGKKSAEHTCEHGHQTINWYLYLYLVSGCSKLTKSVIPTRAQQSIKLGTTKHRHSSIGRFVSTIILMLKTGTASINNQL